ncbi:DUF2982 domain-containing protein [Pseudoalteromonas tunicata]|jgi:hypothetical protein|uniref:DUF2982 domain-containing protein n=1 Tax=Pseudoalteromonas tunicata D2 TaxID=87626 RepID=A4C7N6_9GAMM|nr:DUF2982 domain-containing protein [Pseudoalteromonas tunicata]AXT31497.1 DUF2982 domain-containing protein [Pseudoalteromonas tunicata]EAR29990.1 hypothetical protein PTD2_14259 [Pseudoalteromonas tunicata D2]MDP4984546.1 DUF2982 domain-containing protein [Pseudoalteromonas tunicata]
MVRLLKEQMRLVIQASSNKHGVETFLVSSLALLILMLAIKLKPGTILIAEIMLISACLVGMLIGYFKMTEPRFSLVFYQDQLEFHHKYGCWELTRENLAVAGIPSIGDELLNKPLNCVGLKVKDYDSFLQQLAPRLAARILIEQRHLLRESLREKYQQIQDVESFLVENTDFCSQKGQVYSGLIAMFANRMINLRQLIGYDLLIPLNMLDRNADQFVYLIHRWQLNAESILSPVSDELSL